MKNLKAKLIGLLVLLVSIAIIMPTKVLATNEGVQIVCTESKDYIIYVKNVANEFEFAILQKMDATETELESAYQPSVTDDAGNKVAIVTAYKYNTIKDKTNYLYVKSDGNLVIKAMQLDFTKAFNKSDMQLVEETTKRINTEVDTLKEEQTVDGVKKTTIVGVLNIVDDQSATYSYQRTKLPANKYSELMTLAEQINSTYGNLTMYSKIELAQQFYNLYIELIPSEWIAVENMQVLQPTDAQDGENYVVFLKKVDANDQETIDVKFLTSYREDAEEKIPASVETRTVNETTKLPITYDSIILFVIFAVILVALIVVGIRMKTMQGKGKHK